MRAGRCIESLDMEGLHNARDYSFSARACLAQR